MSGNMTNCAILSCKNSTNKDRGKENVSFHVFPTDPKIKEKWIDATGQKNWFPTNCSRICSKHFPEECFVATPKSRRLQADAVPTIDVLKPSHAEEIIEEPPSPPDDTPLLFNSPNERKLSYQLKYANKSIIDKNKELKRLRTKIRRQDLKLEKLITVITCLKKKLISDGKEVD